MQLESELFPGPFHSTHGNGPDYLETESSAKGSFTGKLKLRFNGILLEESNVPCQDFVTIKVGGQSSKDDKWAKGNGLFPCYFPRN